MQLNTNKDESHLRYMKHCDSPKPLLGSKQRVKPWIGYRTSNLNPRAKSGDKLRRKLVMPAKLAPTAAREAVLNPVSRRLRNTAASGANSAPGGFSPAEARIRIR